MKNHLWTRAIFEGYQYLKKIIRILDKQVINIAGDGSFGMNCNELVTAAKNKLPII